MQVSTRICFKFWYRVSH